MSADAKTGVSFSSKVDRRKVLGAAATTAGMLLLKRNWYAGRPRIPRCVLHCLGAEGAAPKTQPIWWIQAERAWWRWATYFRTNWTKLGTTSTKFNKPKGTRRWTLRSFLWGRMPSSRLPLQRK